MSKHNAMLAVNALIVGAAMMDAVQHRADRSRIERPRRIKRRITGDAAH